MLQNLRVRDLFILSKLNEVLAGRPRGDETFVQMHRDWGIVRESSATLPLTD